MKDRILKLRKDSNVTETLKFEKGQLFQFIMGVLYIDSYPLKTNLQKTIEEWMEKNPELFSDYKF